MITKNKTLAKLKAGGVVFGAFIPFPVPAVIESLAGIGMDYVFIDLEHNLMSGEAIQQLIMACEIADLTPLVRVPIKSIDAILPLLEQGAMGIILPHTQTKAEVEAVVEQVKYVPEGKRGMWSASRAAGFGAIPLSKYVAEANRETMVICIVEDEVGYRNLSDILSVKEVDLIILGHEDLGQALGHTGQYEHPVVKKAIDKILSSSYAAGKFVGIGSEPSNIEDAGPYFASFYERGVRLFLLNPLRLMRNVQAEFITKAKSGMKKRKAK